MTREELIALLASKRARKLELTWAQFTGAVGGLTDAQKEKVLAFANEGSPAGSAKLGEVLVKVAAAKKLALATLEVENLAADDSLTVQELLDLLG